MSENSAGYGYSLGAGSADDIPGGTAPWAFGKRAPPPPPSSLAGVPRARSVVPLNFPHEFETPQKRIASRGDIDKFLQSEGGLSFIGFIVCLSDSVQGKKISEASYISPKIKAILSILDKLNEWVDQIPPKQTPLRYGNPAFRDWQHRLQEEGYAAVQDILPDDQKPAIEELFPYFADSFGNATRIDYGTGHEANFAAWLLCLARLGLIREEDYQAVVLKVFAKYLDLMRKIQTTYYLEPAGSHGVWGLDDYQFLPYIFGSSQLVGHKYLRPRSIHNEDILEHYSSDYFYLACITFIKSVKKGPMAEHSPMINDISGVQTWNKVNSGMLKMYRAEVLEKVPIMQHFLFGSIIRWPK